MRLTPRKRHSLLAATQQTLCSLGVRVIDFAAYKRFVLQAERALRQAREPDARGERLTHAERMLLLRSMVEGSARRGLDRRVLRRLLLDVLSISLPETD